MKVYIELIFLDNFLIDYLLLYMASGCYCRRKLLRILTGGIIGGIYGVLCVLIPLFSRFAFRILMGVFMCAITFGFNRSLLKATVCFFGASFLLGGSVFFFFFRSYPDGNSVSGRIILSGIFLAVTILECSKRFRTNISGTINTEADIGGEKICFTAEHDTGLLVHDEYGNGVILLDKNYAEKKLSKKILEDIALCPNSKTIKTRWFTVSTAAGKKRIIGVHSDHVILNNGKTDLLCCCYILMSEHITINGSPAIYGDGLKTEELLKNDRYDQTDIF